MSIDAPQGEKAALKCKVGNDEVLICSLREGGQESTNLDLILDSYTEFSLVSKSGSANASIHLAGYLIAEGEEEDEDDEEYDEEDAEDGTCCSLDHDHHHDHSGWEGVHRLALFQASPMLSMICICQLSALKQDYLMMPKLVIL